MAQDVRPYKSKEQDGQGNEIILRDQQLVEQTSQTTMASGEYFEIVDVDGRMAKIPKDNMIGVVREALGTLLNGLADQTTVAKALTLNGDTLGASTAATLASVLGAQYIELTSTDDLDNLDKPGIYYWSSVANTPANAAANTGSLLLMWITGYGKYQVQLPNTLRESVNGGVNVRRYWIQNGWSSWGRLYDDSMLTNSAILSPLASALGGVRKDISNGDINVLSNKLYSKSGLARLGNGATVTIQREKPAQCILICGNNGPAPRIPGIYVISRDKIEQTICEGFIGPSDISVDTTTGNISIAKNSSLALYYRLIEMEE